MYVTLYSLVSKAVTAQRDSVEIMAIWLELIVETTLAGKPLLGKWGFLVALFDARVGSPILSLPQHSSHEESDNMFIIEHPNKYPPSKVLMANLD